MNCLACGHKNPNTIGYCQKCGGRMDLTADEIHDALMEKARNEVVETTEHYARQSLIFAVVILMIMFTLLILSGGAPEDAYYIPSVSNGATHVQLENFEMGIELDMLRIPFQNQR